MKRIADKHWKIGAPGSARNLSETNSLILPGVPWQREMQLIESGRAHFKMTENGIPTWENNGRIYGAHINKKGEKWVPYPRSGPGLVTVSKRAYKILEIIDASDSLETAFKQLQRRGITSEELSLLWRIWESLRQDSHDE